MEIIVNYFKPKTGSFKKMMNAEFKAAFESFLVQKIYTRFSCIYDKVVTTITSERDKPLYDKSNNPIKFRFTIQCDVYAGDDHEWITGDIYFVPEEIVFHAHEYSMLYYSLERQKQLTNGWINKNDAESLPAGRPVGGYTVIDVDFDNMCCIFHHAKRRYHLGTENACRILQGISRARYVVGHYDTYESEWFLLLKDEEGPWYAFRNDCDEVFRIEDITILDYELVMQLDKDFLKKKTGHDRYGLYP